MIGIIFYFVFLFIGFFYGARLTKDESLCVKLWTGGILGNVILMCGIVPFGLIAGFTGIGHVLLLAAALVPGGILIWKEKRFRIGDIREKPFFDEAVSPAVFAVLTALFVLICLLLVNHVMEPTADGIASGQSTYGDLAMHMGFVTSIAEQGKFPPSYNQLAGVRLGYPFLIDSLSASLYLFGTPLRWAILLPSFSFVWLLVFGFYFLAFRFLKNRKWAMAAVIFFFFNGGFGFSYFLEGAKENPEVFTKFFTGYYTTPTNYNDHNIRWSNVICDMIIPQRTTMAGWTLLLFLLCRLWDMMKKPERSGFILMGLIGGCMVMVHTHSFMAFVIISACCLCIRWIFDTGEPMKKSDWINWGLFAGMGAALAIPQLLIWTLGNIGDGFIRLAFNWVNHKDPYLWFWLKNWGIAAIFAVPGFLSAKKDHIPFLTGAVMIFVLAELILFQPNEYDNNKLFYVSYIFVIIMMCRFFMLAAEKLQGVRGRGWIGALILFFGTFSGVLTVVREYHSGGIYQTFSHTEIAFAEEIRSNTAPDAVFLTGTQHLNPVSVLAGRTVFVGSSLYVYFHGFGTEYQSRSKQAEAIYQAVSAKKLREAAQNAGIDYLVVTPKERKEYTIRREVLDSLTPAFESTCQGYEVYRINES